MASDMSLGRLIKQYLGIEPIAKCHPTCISPLSCDTDGKLAQQIFTRTAVEAGNTSCTNVETNYEELEYCQNGSCRPSTGKNSTVDTNQLAIMTNEDHKEHVSNFIMTCS